MFVCLLYAFKFITCLIYTNIQSCMYSNNFSCTYVFLGALQAATPMAESEISLVQLGKSGEASPTSTPASVSRGAAKAAFQGFTFMDGVCFKGVVHSCRNHTVDKSSASAVGLLWLGAVLTLIDALRSKLAVSSSRPYILRYHRLVWAALHHVDETSPWSPRFAFVSNGPDGSDCD